MPQSHPGKPLTPIEAVIPPLLQSLPQMLEVEAVPLEQALARILGRDVTAPINVPPHANSAMDGYALRAADSQSARGLVQVSQRIAAGQVGEPLQTGTAARIFTGAPLPPGADAVVMQENTRAEDEAISILQAVVPGENVRAAGEDIVAGAKLFGEGRRLRPQDIGVLASVGLTHVTVRRALRVALLVTGDELVPPGTELKPGQIYNSNNYTIAALLRNLGAEIIEMGVVGDEFNTTQNVLKTAAEEVDVIISTGGVSVGEEDHVRPAVESLGGLDIWKLAIKPGKPFASGKVCGKQFFGLPGNPVSAFVTFVLLVRPALLSMQACDRPFTDWIDVPAGFDRAQCGERQEYIRVTLGRNAGDGLSLKPFDNQSSGAGASLSEADGLAIIPPHTAVAEGDKLRYLSFAELIN